MTADERDNSDDAALGIVFATAGMGLAAARLIARTPGLAPYFERAAAHGREQVGTTAERLVVVFEPEAEKMLQQFLDSPQAERMLQQVLDSGQFDQVLERVLTSPKVRQALAQQTTSWADEVLQRMRARLRALDQRCAGLASRTLAFGIDLTLAQISFLIVSAIAALISGLVGGLRPHWLFESLAAFGWVTLVGAYFAFFWSLAGQTPGMRLVGIRVVDGHGSPPHFVRAAVRFVALLVAIAPMFLGLLPIVFDKRRRGLQDFVAHTFVVPA